MDLPTQSTAFPRDMTRIGSATVFSAMDTDMIWRFAGLSADKQAKATTSRVVARFSALTGPQIAGVIPPTSTHSSVQHWKWLGAQSRKILIHLRDSYAVPITKYELQGQVNESSNPNDRRRMIMSEYVLMPGTLSMLKRDAATGEDHMIHRSDHYVACALKSRPPKIVSGRQGPLPAKVIVAVDETLAGAFAALVQKGCYVQSARFIQPTKKPRKHVLAKIEKLDERRAAAVRAIADKRAAARAKRATRATTKRAKATKRASALSRLAVGKAPVIDLT